MASGGPFSVWDISKSVTWDSNVRALQRFVVYHGMAPGEPSRIRMLLQVELTHSLIGGSKRITGAALIASGTRLFLSAWQGPVSVTEELHLLLGSTVDVHKFRNSPHELILSGGEDGSEEIAVLRNVMLR